jgi:hypothetical protein
LPIVLFGAPEWQLRVREALAAQGMVRVLLPPLARGWKGLFTELLSTAVESGFLQFYPMVEAIRAQHNGQIAVDLLLRERV